MLDYVRLNIAKLIPRVISAIKAKNVLDIKELSNHTIHSASVYQDQSSLSFAVTVYSLSKIVERCTNCDDLDVFIAKVIFELEHSKDLLLMNHIDEYKISRKKLFELISKMDVKLKLYIDEVIDKAKISKGSKLYEHGLSISQVANLLDISEWELMNYVGKIKHDQWEPAISAKDRLIFARKIFGV